MTGPQYIELRNNFVQAMASMISQQVSRGKNLDEVLTKALVVLGRDVREVVQEIITD